tara:strand:+ start:34 stop:1104 length:1071 start_codon:yes stop_codon:yes gene_type:complete
MAYAAITKPSLHFKTKLFTGDGNATKAITGVGFQPDWVWIKKRNGVASHITSNVVSGVTKTLYTESTSAELTNNQYGWVSAFGTDGFTTTNTNANAINGNGDTYVSWNWKAGNSSGSANNDGSITSTVSVNTTAGFSIVKWSASANATIGHGLGVKPAMVITKSRDNATGWATWHKGVSGTEQNVGVVFNTNAAESSFYTNYWGTGGITSSVIGTLNSGFHNNAGEMIAFCFAEKKGFSKFGRYRGTGNADNGAFIHTGFKPSLFIQKRVDTTNDWHMHDNKRNTFNPLVDFLMVNSTNAEANDTGKAIDFLSNGVKMRTTHASHNASGGSYIYMAFAENPFVANVGSNGIPATAV